MINSAINEQLLDEKLVALEKARAWSPRVISKLESFIRTSDDFALFRVNVPQFAAARGISEAEAIDLFLYATKIGLFEMEWQLVCPSCGHVIESLTEFSRLHSHIQCPTCFVETEATLDDYIQVSFTISLPVRDNIFRYPERLSAEDFYYRYSMSQDALFTDGRLLVDVMKDLTRFVGYLAANETVNLKLNLTPGVLQLIDLTKSPLVTFAVTDQTAPEEQRVVVSVIDGCYRSVSPQVAPHDVPGGPYVHKIPQLGIIASGAAELVIENRMEKPTPLWIRLAPPGAGDTPLAFEPFLSGKKLLTTQTFRDLFRSETLQTDEEIAVKDITFLFTDLKGSTALYDQVGDAKAYYLVRQHFDTLGRVISQNSGAVVKTIGDAVMATFMNPADAVNAAIHMLEDIGTFNKGITQDLILKIGIHRGHSIVVTLNDRLDYFGQTVNIAARVQGLADSGEIFVSDDAFNDPGIHEVVAGHDVSSQTTDVKGVSRKLHVHKVTL